MAYDFNGTDQIFDTASTPITNRPCTLACWFQSDDATLDQGLISLGDSSEQTYYALTAAGSAAGDPLYAETRSATGSVFSHAVTTTGYSTGTWHHGCATFASNIKRDVWIDGGSTGTNGTSRATGTISYIELAAVLDGGTPLYPLNGRLAEVGIWNVALTPAEVAILALGYAPPCVRPQSLKFYAPLVRELYDSYGGRDLIVYYGTPTVAIHPRIIYPHRPRFQTGMRVTAFPRSYGMVIG